MKYNKHGFTLVELLAVIVILAIILVIAVPKVMSVIEDSKKATLESTAKMIASAAEKAKVQNTVLGKDKEIKCEDVVELNDMDYERCIIEFENDTAKVTITGKGKFANLYVCDGTKTSSNITEDYCPTVAVEYIKALYDDSTLRSQNGLIKDDTLDENIRYSGSNDDVKNYVEFNDELWRIVGIFDVKETEESVAVSRIKLIRNERIGKYSWDSSAGDVNNGGGVNEWSQADLNILLNNTYYNKISSETCYNDQNNVSTSCDFSNIGLTTTAKSMITTVVWNTAGVTAEEGGIASTSYEKERGTRTGQICKGTMYMNGIYCTDEVERTLAYEGTVGLIYPSDYMYASTDNNCRTNGTNEINLYCKNSNWLQTEYAYWFISPYPVGGGSLNAWVVSPDGYVRGGIVGDDQFIYPSVYLSSNVKIIGGEGTEKKPYTLSV